MEVNAMTQPRQLDNPLYRLIRNEDIKGFEVAPREGSSSHAQLPSAAPTGRQKYERASAEELAAFEAAWQKGQEMQIGDRIYSSDLAPLGDDSAGRKR